ncbi:hypothetical protein PAENI_19490 [Paenibacillus sp. B2(2019)]|nr:hypothetical protein PAENI_19490 [Paenibacillus sp. B2(2019)]
MKRHILLHEVQLNALLGSGELSRQASWYGAECCTGVEGELVWRGMLRRSRGRVCVVRNSCTFYTYFVLSGYEMDLVVFNAAIMRSIAVHSQMLRI